jgi:hypothetical protein
MAKCADDDHDPIRGEWVCRRCGAVCYLGKWYELMKPAEIDGAHKMPVMAPHSSPGMSA